MKHAIIPQEARRGALQYYLQRPPFLTQEDEEKLLEFVKENQLESFYNHASTLIGNTGQVTNLYIYLWDKLVAQGKNNDEFREHVCWRLFERCTMGWLGVPDPALLQFCKENTQDKELLKEIRNTNKKLKKFDMSLEKYEEYLPIENQIQVGLHIVEKGVIKLGAFFQEFTQQKGFDEKQWNCDPLKKLEQELSIYKGGQLMGRLISEQAQEQLGFKTIAPHLMLEKKDGRLRIS